MNLNPHFSVKVFLLSLIFLLASLGVHVLHSFTETEPSSSFTGAFLTFETGQQVRIKPSYASNWTQAVSGQMIDSGTEIQTSQNQQAGLVLGKNRIRFQENTTLKLIENNVAQPSLYSSQEPRLIFELKEGEIWVDAFDPVVLQWPQAEAVFHHSSGLVTYKNPSNRLMMLKGDAHLSLFDSSGASITHFIVPLGNQVNFVDSQITEIYRDLKASKLKKELKFSALNQDILNEKWFQDASLQAENRKEDLIRSSLAYQLKTASQKFLSWFSFLPVAEENMAVSQIETKLNYILGQLSEAEDRTRAKEVLLDLEPLVTRHLKTPSVLNLLRKALFDSERSDFATVNYMLKDFILDKIEPLDGPFLLRVYLDDLTTLLFKGDLQQSEVVLKKWQDKWTEEKISKNYEEYHRQGQILNYILQANIQRISVPLLDIFDATGAQRLSLEEDLEEARFEVAQERLQITASLVSQRRYVLAKQYLKNSYLSLKIEDNDQALPSTQIFLETGRLLAQRLDYAEKILKNADQPIDETKFLEYLQSKARDKALTDDLKTFFALEQEKEGQVITATLAPTFEEVATRFKEAGVQVSPADIQLVSVQEFLFQVKNARLTDLDSQGKVLSFEANYDFTTASVTEVKTQNNDYKGPFLLTDLVTLLKNGNLNNTPSVPEAGDVGLLISDQGRAEEMQGQAVARDLGLKLAINKLTEVGINIPDLKSDIQVLDELNLDKFKINRAVIEGIPEKEFMTFNYFSTLGKVTDIRNASGTLLLKESDLSTLATTVLGRFKEIEKETLAVQNFKAFMTQNDLTITDSNIVYTAEDLLLLTDLNLATLGLKATGLYDVGTGRFLSVKNDLVNLQNVTIKDFFEQAADVLLIQKFKEKEINVLAYQIESAYPFRSIKLKNVQIGTAKFEFSLNFQDFRPFNIRHLDMNKTLENMTFDELKEYADDL